MAGTSHSLHATCNAYLTLPFSRMELKNAKCKANPQNGFLQRNSYDLVPIDCNHTRRSWWSSLHQCKNGFGTHTAALYVIRAHTDTHAYTLQWLHLPTMHKTWYTTTTTSDLTAAIHVNLGLWIWVCESGLASSPLAVGILLTLTLDGFWENDLFGGNIVLGEFPFYFYYYWILLEQQMMGWQGHQLDHMQIICTMLQTDNHASTS